MITRKYEVLIQANKAKVWFCLWDDYHYRAWVSVFCEGSYAKAENWQTGSKIHFLGPDGGGMFSSITENIPLEKMFFTHHGTLKNFEEQPQDEEDLSWAGAREIYTLTEEAGGVKLTVEIDLDEKFLDYFDTSFPSGLERVKSLAEDFYITIQSEIAASIEEVWEKWTNPNDVIQWNAASPDWHTPKATNELEVGKKFSYRMEAKDGSVGFDFEGVYTQIIPNQYLEYVMADNRRVKTTFVTKEDKVHILSSFQAENVHSFEMQLGGWQSILNNFSNYVTKTP